MHPQVTITWGPADILVTIILSGLINAATFGAIFFFTIEEIAGIRIERRLNLYSPKIYEKYIPDLYVLAKNQDKPMTQLVNEIIEKALKDMEAAKIA